MRIGIDIDDTLTQTREIFPKKIKAFRKKYHLKKYSERQQLSDEQFFNFGLIYGKEVYLSMKEKKHAIKIIQKWILEGHEIYFITARSNKDVPNVEKYTREYLEKRKIKYKEIVFDAKNKYLASKKFNLDVYIDDQERMLDTFQAKDAYLIRFVRNKKIKSKYQKATKWKEIEKIVENL